MQTLRDPPRAVTSDRSCLSEPPGRPAVLLPDRTVACRHTVWHDGTHSPLTVRFAGGRGRLLALTDTPDGVALIHVVPGQPVWRVKLRAGGACDEGCGVAWLHPGTRRQHGRVDGL